jgi:hypothetical protein
MKRKFIDFVNDWSIDSKLEGMIHDIALVGKKAGVDVKAVVDALEEARRSLNKITTQQ